MFRDALALVEDAAVEKALDELDPARMDGWSAYVFGIAWALSVAPTRAASPSFAAAGGDLSTIDLSTVPGLDLFVTSDVPIGAGLSSSAALECSVAVAMTELWGLDVNRAALAAVGHRARDELVVGGGGDERGRGATEVQRGVVGEALRHARLPWACPTPSGRHR